MVSFVFQETKQLRQHSTDATSMTKSAVHMLGRPTTKYVSQNCTNILQKGHQFQITRLKPACQDFHTQMTQDTASFHAIVDSAELVFIGSAVHFMHSSLVV